MKKIVVFGATGNIGPYIVDYCNEHIDKSKFEVIAVGRKKTEFFTKNGIEYIRVDITKSEDFYKLPQMDVYAVINVAGILPAYFKEYNPYAYIETNITGAIRILEYARNCEVDRVLYTQTWAEQAGYWGKTDILKPDMARKLIYKGDHAFYTITKTMMVETMEYYKQEFGIKNFVFRLPNVYLYHPNKDYYVDGNKRVIPYRYMIDRAVKGMPIEMWGNPDAFKDILYVKDLCQMMYKALFANISGGTYNAGTGIRTTLKQQIEGIIDVMSPIDNKSIIVPKPDKGTFTSFVMDISNAKNELGYNPVYTYKEYLEDYKKEMQEKRFDELWLNKK